MFIECLVSVKLHNFNLQNITNNACSNRQCLHAEYPQTYFICLCSVTISIYDEEDNLQTNVVRPVD